MSKQVYKQSGELVGELLSVVAGWTKALTPDGNHVSFRNKAVVVREEGEQATGADVALNDEQAPKAEETEMAKSKAKAPKAAKKDKAPKQAKLPKAKLPKAKAPKAAKKPKSTEPRVHRIKGAVVDLSRYTKVASAAGHSSYDNGDAAALKLRSKDLDLVYEIVAKALSKAEGDTTPEKVERELKARYGKLNVGMQRMNLGNRYRAFLREAAGE